MRLLLMLFTIMAMTVVAQDSMTACQVACQTMYGSYGQTQQTQFMQLFMSTLLKGNNLNIGGIISLSYNLVKYFNGRLPVVNRNNTPTYITFLDGVGNGSPIPGTNTEKMVTSMARYFGQTFGCNHLIAYSGNPSMYEVHKFMKLSKRETSYFIDQIILTAKYLKIPDEAASTVNTTFYNMFNQRCSPPATTDLYPSMLPYMSNNFQSICTDDTCDLAGDDCTYNNSAPADGSGATSQAVGPIRYFAVGPAILMAISFAMLF